MRAVSLARVAAEAELLRIQHMLKRQGMRAAFGMIAAMFAVGVLVLCNVAGWQVLRWYVQPIYATLGNCSPWGNDATLGTGSSGGQVILKQP